MAESVYILCAVTSFFCCALLLRAYKRSGMKLLLWSGLCFAGLFLNNLLLVVDLVLTGPTVDLSIVRILPAVFGTGFLLYGLVWNAT